MKHLTKNIILSTAIPVLLFGFTSGSAFASKSAKKRVYYKNFPANFEEEEAGPTVSRGYEPSRSPQFNDEFGS